MSRIKVMLIPRDEQRKGELQRKLSAYDGVEVVGFYLPSTGARYAELVKMAKPDIFMLDAEVPEADPLQLIRHNAENYPFTGTILLMKDKNFEILQEAMRLGVQGCFTEPLNFDEIHNRMVDIYTKSLALRTGVAAKASATAGDAATAATTMSFISPKDGEGKTTIAVNLAAALSVTYGHRVILLDLSSTLSEVAMLLDRQARASYYDVIQMMGNEFKFERLDECMIDYKGDKKLRVLCGPITIRPPELKQAEIEVLIRLLQQNCDYLLIDAPVILNECLTAALNLSHWHVAITQNHIGSLRNIKLYLSELKRLNFPPHRVKVVLNRCSPKAGLKASEMDRYVDPYPIVAQVTSAGIIVLNALNEGKPFVLAHPEAEISENVDRFARLILGMVESQTAQFSFKNIFQGMFG